MAELADAPDLGSGGRPWGFESLYPHFGMKGKEARRPCKVLRAFVILKGSNLKERENVDGFFVVDICGIFYHISGMLLCIA